MCLSRKKNADINNVKKIGDITIRYTKKFVYFLDKNGKKGSILSDFRNDIKKDLYDLKGEFIYVYFFVDRKLRITKKDSIIYIGRSISVLQETYTRFLHEIYDNNDVTDNAKQYTLTHFYINHIPMRLEVFFVQDAKKNETELLVSHQKIFGYLPIANGRK